MEKLFKDPTIWPKTLDEMYDLVENEKGNWVWSAQCPINPGPCVTWKQVKEINDQSIDDQGTGRLIIESYKIQQIIPSVRFTNKGMLDILEKDLFELLIKIFATEDIGQCKPVDDKVMIYGSSVQKLFDELLEFVR